LQGTDLAEATLQGANLFLTRLQGANLSFAQLQGADLTAAYLQGADLAEATLQGANLLLTQLQGADLPDAQLQGTNLGRAQLQGANLRGADMSDSDLNEAFVFRTDVGDADLATADVSSVHVDEVQAGEMLSSPPEPLAPVDVEAWIAVGTEFAPGVEKDEIVKRFDRLKPDFHEETDKPKWSGLEEASRSLDPDGVKHRQRLADRLGELACDPDGAPYVARGLVGMPELNRTGRLPALGDQLESVRKRMKDGRKKPDTCKGVAGFTEDDWRRLDAIKPAEAAPAGH
jgi:Pentapeptide repeats (8 copies)